MNQTAKINLNLAEFENFRAIAERFNVEFDVNHRNDVYIVTAPRDKLLEWGYLEDQEPDE